MNLGVARASEPASAGEIADAAGGTCGPTCGHDHGGGARSPFMVAMMTAAARTSDPAAAMARLMDHARYSTTCYGSDADPEAIANDMTRFALRPVNLGPVGTIIPKFFSSGTVWNGNVAVGQTATRSAGQAARATLTYSFPDDGPTWGTSTSGFTPAPNALNAAITALFGASAQDRGRELCRQALASWRRSAGIDYTEVSDDESNFSNSTLKSGTRGDIRIGGIPLGRTTTVLAYNQFPSSGGDMVINTSYMTGTTQLASFSNGYRYWRNVVAHEHGHGLGYQHVIPCSGTFLMEPQISTNFNMVTIDERRGAGRNYGDRLSGNNAPVRAVDIGNLTSPAFRSVRLLDLSTNGPTGTNSSNQDWFRFTVSSSQRVIISATPTGGSYLNDPQTSNCIDPASPTTINATNIGDLALRVYTSNGQTLLFEAALNGVGVAETIDQTFDPGTYTIQVIDVTPGTSSNATVQLYDLAALVPGFTSEPQAIAGINKRIAANTTCYFIGDVNSRATNPGGSISAYAWDLDANGTFESNSAQPTRTYPSNGVFPVTLRVTDNQGRIATDTINVTVFGATTSINSVTPANAALGVTVPVVILGANLMGVTNASQVNFGPGITVSGTPAVSQLGTRIDGLSITTSPSATLGTRDVTITNSDGLGASGTGFGEFTIDPPPATSLCVGDIAYDTGVPLPPFGLDPGAVNNGLTEGDYNLFFSSYFDALLVCDIADDGGFAPARPGEANNGVTEADYNVFFSVYFNGCP
ncbi:MAG: pre-peptidase C-terminal domain-containing protein [Phycisphaerales bacterium]|nr:pre-peptidase C-terminal domain-containing protein [Phycisphaerales bacterium]